MNVSQITETFSNLSPEEQIEFLVVLGHELTIAVRETYEVDGAGVIYPAILRQTNEIQHTLLGHLFKLLQTDVNRYPDKVLMQIICESEDEGFKRMVLQAITRSIKFLPIAA